MENILSRLSRSFVDENDAAWRVWLREPITTLSGPWVFMFRIIRTDYHAGRIFIPHRPRRNRRRFLGAAATAADLLWSARCFGLK